MTNEKDLVKAFAKHIGLQETETEMVFWHMYFGRDIMIDLSASNSEKWAIMKHVFDVAVQFGEDKKLREIRMALGVHGQ